MKTDFSALERMIEGTAYSESLYRKALLIYANPTVYDKVTRAWAFWYGTQAGFMHKINTWTFNKGSGDRVGMFQNKKTRFAILKGRLDNVIIMSRDAIDVISATDSEDTFFYLDPPYINTTMGHYKGYSETDYRELLNTLVNVKGRFLLSSFESELLNEYTIQCGWASMRFDRERNSSAFNHSGKKAERKIEVLTANYEIGEV